MNWVKCESGSDVKGGHYIGNGPYPEDGERVLCEISHREGIYYMVLEYSKFEDESNEPPFLLGEPIYGVRAWCRIESSKFEFNSFCCS